MNIKDIGTQLLYTTLPIWVEKYNDRQEPILESGTGFVLLDQPTLPEQQGGIPLLITNYHVVKDARRGVIEVAERDGELPAKGKRIRIEIPADQLLKFVHKVDDLAAIPLGPALNQAEQAGKPVFFRSISRELFATTELVQQLGAIEEVTFIGYPSGLYDEHNVTPLVRRGVTATPIWNDFRGKPAFLIDAGVFPGSSGSPVFLYNHGSFASGGNIVVGTRLLFLGVITETMVRADDAQTNVFLGIGKVVKSIRVHEFVKTVIQELTTNLRP